MNLRLGMALSGSRNSPVWCRLQKEFDDVEKPSLEVLSLLEHHGAIVDIYDPFVPGHASYDK